MNLRQKQFIDSYIGIPLVYLHIGMARLLGLLLRRDHSINKQPKEICFIKLLGYGSVVMASDAIFSIKRKFPETKISIVCSRSIEHGVRSLKLFDEVHVIDDSGFIKVIVSSLVILFKLQRVKRLWTVDLEIYSKLTGIFALWTLAINRFGFYFNHVAFRYNLNSHNVFFNTLIKIEDNYQEMAKATGANSITPFTIPGFPKRTERRHYGYIAINNTCSDLSRERKMTTFQLAALCNWILENTPYQVSLLGAPSDKEDNQRFIEALNKTGEMKNIAGNADFEPLYRFLYNDCALLVTIDSAPLHIANKLNVPVVSIWGPTAPGNYIDAGTSSIPIYLNVHCSPCVHHVKHLPCGGNNFCIKDISLESVTDAIQEVINYSHD